MRKFLRKIFPLLVFYAATGLVMSGLYFIADTFGMDRNGALFLLLVCIFGGFFAAGFVWCFGSLIMPRLPLLGRFCYILAVAVYVFFVVSAFVNIFYPVPWVVLH